MRNILKQAGLALLLVAWFIPNFAMAQLCEPIYKVEKPMLTGTSTGEMLGDNYTTIATIGQPTATMDNTNNYTHSSATGFWSHYLKEPASPLVRASDGDFQDLVFIEWDIEGDRTGPPVTSDEVTLYRNGYVLTTLPTQQTQYLDFNVFPGMYYTYGVSVENDMGESHTDDNVGFLNPNGMITGNVSTPSGNPVIDTKVKLTPNLGRCAKFNGDSYIYWFDSEINTNRQFSGLENDYTIETWFRSAQLEEQVFFAAVDSNSTNHYITLELTEDGKVKWTHQPTAGEAGTELVTSNSFAGPGADWHHLAVVYADSNASMTMYIDGFLMGEATTSGNINDKVEIVLGKQGPREPFNYFEGRLDDFRIWSIPREWDDLRKRMDITLSGEQESLAAYWKFDEVEGEVIFDLTDADIDGEVCGFDRDNYLAPVFLGALTDMDGNYAIKGIYYGEGTVFTVTPSLASPIGRSLEFDGEDDFIRFGGQRIDLTAGYTLEGWFKTSSGGEHTLFAAVNPADDSHRLSVGLSGGQVSVSHFETDIVSDAFNDNLWHHYAISNDNTVLTFYVDGIEVGSEGITQVVPDPSEMVIGRSSPEQSGGYFEGRLDEMRLWNMARTAEQIGGTMNQVLEGDNYGLSNYWRMNEGVDSLITDATGTITGTIVGADSVALKAMWSKDIPLNEYFDHWYEPESRNCALSSSNTAVNSVDFTDESMIPVSGYVRYVGTACFQEGVEILLNGESFIPPIWTDDDGKFILELEPGAVGQMISCYYLTPGTGIGDEDEILHEFIPPLIELPMIVQPIAGLFFDDRTAYKINGYVAGGSCRFPITPSQGQIEVTFSAVNGCIEETVVPDEATGMYESPDLPSLIYNVSVNHPDPDIDEYFMAYTLSLEKSDREMDFIYRAPPMVEFVELPESEYETEAFPLMLKQRQLYQAGFEVFEPYGENRCLIQSFDLEVFDNISDTTYSLNLTGEGTPHIQFTGSKVNLLSGGEHPYQNNLQIVVSDTLGRTSSTDLWAFVEGDEKIPGVNFSTTTSKMPWFVLRVPPGDGSVTMMTSNQTICQEEKNTTSNNFNEALKNTYHAGKKTQIVATAGLGVQVGTITTIGVKVDIGANFSFSQNLTDIEKSCNCLTTSETYSTSGDGITGDTATVFIGGGYTVDMGLAKYIYFDAELETVAIDTVITTNTEGVHSTYIYSKYYIENVIMQDLWTIWTVNNDTTALEDYNYWQSILDADAFSIANAIHNDSLMIGSDGEASSNISFDAGASLNYSYSTKVNSSYSHSFAFTNAEELFLAEGFSVAGLGFDCSQSFSHKYANNNTTKNDTTKTQKIGFVLNDNDPGDGFAFTVKSDPNWGMPVFELIGGQSSCPYESGNVRRHVAVLGIDENLQVDVPPDEPAVFTLSLGNNSDTDEGAGYVLSALNATNPYSAQLFTTENLANGVPYFLEAGEVNEITLQVFRGPEAYEYDGLTLDLSPACGGQNETSDQVSFSVHFQEPCSESNIASPEDGWLIDDSHGSDTLWVTVNGYTFPPDTFTTSIDLQYRSASGGDWFTAHTVLADSLIDPYVLMPFNISDNIIIDGGYELRAQAQCTAGKYPGTSAVVSGFIDRTAPQVLGLPEPVDGILGPDDLIRVTFNEDLACGEISPGAGDIMLYNTVNDNEMDYVFTCGGNVVTFEPNVQNMFIENQIFRGEIHNLQDSYGNIRPADDPIIWEFYVNRNPLEWDGTDVDNVVIYVDEEYSTTRQLENNGGSNRSWEIIGGRQGAMPSGNPLDLPTWLDVTPLSGTLTPGATQDVSISLFEGLNFGEYSTTIYAAGTMGDEPMIVDIRKLCYEPQWSVSAADYQYSMTITATLSTEEGLSDDVFDRIGVFYGEEIRGVGEVNYVPALEDLPNTHAYEVFLTIYSNEPSGEELSLRVWDASACMELGWIELGWADSSTAFMFESNAVLGTPTMPENIFATSQVIANLDYPAGWTWFSLNLQNEDMSVNNLLANMSPTDGDIIRDQVNFSQFVSEFNGMEINEWVGTFTEFNNRSMSMMKLANADTLEMVGYAVDTELDTIEITSGWNWIGYTPQVSYPVDYAFNSLPSATGDIVKNQFAFAQFVEGLGWIGNLTYMDPKLGYMLKSYYSGQLLYPFYDEPPARMMADADFETKLTDGSPDWNVTPQDFEFSMNITGQLFTHDSLSTDPYDMVGAFVDGECRGMAQPVYIEALNQYLIFMTVYSNVTESEQIEFRSYNADLDEMLYVEETIGFVPNDVIGTVEEPFAFAARYLGIGDEGFIPDVFSLAQNYPNPFNPVTTIAYGLPEASDVTITIYNIMGQQVATLVENQQEPGYYFIRWNSQNDYGIPVSAGIYLYQIRARGIDGDSFVKTKKLVLLK